MYRGVPWRAVRRPSSRRPGPGSSATPTAGCSCHTHAGERGTDLPVANWLVNYDAVWSSGEADQINGRHMRTSSEFDDIFVANMFCPGTVEDSKLEQQAAKRKLSAGDRGRPHATIRAHRQRRGIPGKAS